MPYQFMLRLQWGLQCSTNRGPVSSWKLLIKDDINHKLGAMYHVDYVPAKVKETINPLRGSMACVMRLSHS